MEINKSSIIYLYRSQLEPHPDNPRKDLGDLEELRESIREHGIMQNLTVIPTDDTLEHFRILIGYRRFAASEGILTELPCVMVEWYELACSYKNKFVSYDLTKSKPTLDSHSHFYSVLFSFGFRLPKNLLEVIEGNSDLYQLEGGTKK